MLNAFLLLTFAQIVATISPGPSFVCVSRNALRSRIQGLATATGVATGTLVYATAALCGLGLLFKAFPWLFDLITWGGGLFLLYFAVMLWKHASDQIDFNPATPEVDPPSPARGKTLWSAFLSGFFVQMSNPKAVIFFGSIFVAILPADATGLYKVAAVSLSVSIEYVWFLLVAVFFSHARLRAMYGHAKFYIDRVTSGTLGALGVKLIASRL